MAAAVALCVLFIVRLHLALSTASENDGLRQVSLAVEGGGTDLVGPHCPGTVRLICEGVDLTFLRWGYNGDIDIHSFSSLSNIETIDSLPSPFVSVELRNLVAHSVATANFSSVLTMDLSQLGQTEKVTNISCGNTAVTCTLPVNITIIQEPTPENPQIKVNTTQNSPYALLTVYWEQETTEEERLCTTISLYTVTLLWNGTNYTMTVNSTSCEAQCFVEFSIHRLERDELYAVYLQATDNISVIYSGIIAAVIECSPPQPPLNGSIDAHLATSPYISGTALMYQCDLYPDDIRMTECRNVSGKGEWIPDPSELDCMERETTGAANLCTMPLVNALEHGSLTSADISMGTLVHIRCDEGYTLSGPSIITCTAPEGWSTDLETIQCTDSSTVTSGLVIAITVGIGGGLLTIAVVALLVIVIKCAYSHYQKRGSSVMPLSSSSSAGEKPPAEKETGEEIIQMGMYSTLNHPGVTQAQTDAEAVVIYEEIGPPSLKNQSLSYADVSSQQLEESGTLPKPWSPVNYVTVEGSTESAEPLPERKARDSYVDMARGVSALSELLAATVPDKVKMSATQSYGDVNKERQQTVVAVTDMKLKPNKSYGMVEMQ